LPLVPMIQYLSGQDRGWMGRFHSSEHQGQLHPAKTLTLFVKFLNN